MNYQEALQQAFDKVKDIEDNGKVASYIPELAKVDPNCFGVHISTITEMNCGFGDYEVNFSIQSIAKVFSLCLAYRMLGEKIWDRVGVEPSGNGFNSLLQLEADKGIPRNPFINAGALVIMDILLSNLENPKEDLLNFIRSLSSNKEINYCATVSISEKSYGYRNVALCNFLKSLGNIENEPSQVLEIYFDLCSLEASCKDLSALFVFLANSGKTLTGKEILNSSQSKRMNALMQTCGFYDESGEFAFKVGLAGKSGVGGGTIAIHPGQYAIAAWSPRLNEKLNSNKNMHLLEEFTTLSQKSIF